MEKPAPSPSVTAVPELLCYPVDINPPAIIPARADRDWMDATNQRFAYRCIPMTIANASGWELLLPISFEAVWEGDTRPAGIGLMSDGDPRQLERVVTSHFGEGVLTFHTGYLFRTSPGWALWARGAPNSAKQDIFPLEGLVETDWLPFSFTMNWRFTRPARVRFEAGEPFCFITPIPHALLDDIQPSIRSLDEDPALKKANMEWQKSRMTFNEKLAKLDPETVKQGWQRNYVRGQSLTEERPKFHLSKRKLKAPKSED
jgi:hypothetical protein